jgi:hypothetical protein
MKALLVYSEIPESVRFFVLQNATTEELSILESANGGYINSTSLVEDSEQYKALQHVTAAVIDPKYKEGYPIEQYGIERDVVSKWSEFEVEENTLPSLTGIDRVFSCGFFV